MNAIKAGNSANRVLDRSAVDRRAQPRYPQDLVLTINDLFSEAGAYKSKVRDLSREGFQVETTAELRVGDKIYFDLRLPLLGMVSGVALCCWTRPGKAGLRAVGARIIGLEEDGERRLRCHIRSLPKG